MEVSSKIDSLKCKHEFLKCNTGAYLVYAEQQLKERATLRERTMDMWKRQMAMSLLQQEQVSLIF